MKKILTVIMVLSILASLFGFGNNAKAQAAAPVTTETAAAPAATTTTTTTVVTTPAADAASKPVPAADASATAEANPLENVIYLDLKDGRVTIQLMPEVAPNTVKRVKELTRQGFYDNVPFHRVIDGFMAQTGDPTGTGTGGSGQKLDAEFNSTKHVRGTVSMARAADPNSADSQFFIVFDEAPHLDGNYTAFGKVVEGMEFVDKIKKGSGPNGMVSDPDKIVKMKVAADDKAASTTPAVTAPVVNASGDATISAPAALGGNTTPTSTAPAVAEPVKQ